MTTQRYAEVVVMISHRDVDRIFHYEIPDSMRGGIAIGMRVIVPFGKGGRSCEGYVVGFADDAGVPSDKVKQITGLPDGFSVFDEERLSLARWMKEKYYATMAACLQCVMPAGLAGKKGLAPTRRRKEESKRRNVVDDIVKSGEINNTRHMRLLTGEQEKAVDFLIRRLKLGDTKPVLLHGVTGSGKTEIYMRVVEQVMRDGKQAVVLVPEISLTSQTVRVFMERFGDRLTVTHSRLTSAERLDQWKKAREGQVSIIIGPRSAVFAPFERLGAIIIDEEHEHTYKSETTPKYSTKVVAIERGRLTGALVILGSATPSIESYYEAETGQMHLLKLTERINRMMPDVTVTDMRQELALGNNSVFSQGLMEAMRENIASGGQVILFLNRRGHSTFVSCRKCGYVMACDNCSVNYTYHRPEDRLLCHYCGKSAANPEICPACSSKFIKYFGIGTQKIEDEVRELFPQCTVLRMDMDTTKGKLGHERILKVFREGGAQILIGTQMIAKGLDFPNVTLVGVMAADLSLNMGDFRAAEITYQLLTQVSGRAGRGADRGRVFIQTYNPDHYSIVYAKDNNYEEFYGHEIALRRQMSYPPFTHVFLVMMTGVEEKKLIVTLYKLLDIMKYYNRKVSERDNGSSQGEYSGPYDMIGPTPAVISRIKKQFRWKLLVKSADEEKLRKFVLFCMEKLKATADMSEITPHLTLDPVMLE